MAMRAQRNSLKKAIAMTAKRIILKTIMAVTAQRNSLKKNMAMTAQRNSFKKDMAMTAARTTMSATPNSCVRRVPSLLICSYTLSGRTEDRRLSAPGGREGQSGGQGR